MQVLFSLFKKSRNFYVTFHIYITFSYVLSKYFHTKVNYDTHYVNWQGEKNSQVCKKNFTHVNFVMLFIILEINWDCSPAAKHPAVSLAVLLSISRWHEAKMTGNQLFLWLLLTTVQKSYSSFTPSDVLFWDLLKEKVVNDTRDCVCQNNTDTAIQMFTNIIQIVVGKKSINCWIQTRIWKLSI